MNYFRGSLGLVGLALSAHSFATDLTIFATADDAFSAYISTDANTTGTLFASGSYWGNTYTGTTTLVDGVTNYLHIEAWDVGGVPSMFIGQAALSDTTFYFDNGGQLALSGDSNWSASNSGFGGATTAILDLGANGTSPWGTRPNIDSSARFVWTDGSVATHRYYTVKIQTVPEPATMAVLGIGCLAAIRRRRTNR